MKMSEKLDMYMRKFSVAHREISRKFFQKCGLYTGQPVFLMFVGAHPGISPKEIAKGLNIAPASVAISSRRMENADLIYRVSDDEDHRAIHLFLTKKGEEVFEKCQAGKEYFDGKLYEGFSDKELEMLSKFYDRLALNLDKAWKEMEENEVEIL